MISETGSTVRPDVLVTGATGFVGRHVVAALLARSCAVSVLCRDPAKAAALPWGAEVEVIPGDIASLTPAQLDRLAAHAHILHLAWEGLPNYKAETQVTEVLPRHLAFLTQLVQRGARRLLVSGTCLEYGLVEGALAEDLEPKPVTAYGRAKDGLRRGLEPVCAAHGTHLVWARLFYLHGPGQSEKSLLSQLDRAITAGEKTFNMSGGEQLRDYLPVAGAADLLVRLALGSAATGVVNCASGKPVSVRQLVEEHLRGRGVNQAQNLALNLGHYPYPDYEPMRFWADTSKLAAALAANRDQKP
ncbi:MAG: NAD-dependent epimerase/dehydratase family protein [Humidesulfovibrio sp.]|nr:NAD-dependent epimerase/dehydratase family protein [Humidesulfovibrio sp.]